MFFCFLAKTAFCIKAVRLKKIMIFFFFFRFFVDWRLFLKKKYSLLVFKKFLFLNHKALYKSLFNYINDDFKSRSVQKKFVKRKQWEEEARKRRKKEFAVKKQNQIYPLPIQRLSFCFL